MGPVKLVLGTYVRFILSSLLVFLSAKNKRPQRRCGGPADPTSEKDFFLANASGQLFQQSIQTPSMMFNTIHSPSFSRNFAVSIVGGATPSWTFNLIPSSSSDCAIGRAFALEIC